MKLSIALLALFIFSVPSEAGCSCSSGGDAGFNFLGDPTFDIDMTSFDEFSRASYAVSTMQEPTSFEIGSVKDGIVKEGIVEEASPKEGINNISIDLDDGSHIDLVLYPAGEDLFGKGEMTQRGTGIESANTSEALGVVGVLEGDRLIIEMVSLSGDLYRVDLSRGESGFSGDFVKITPEGETAHGNAKEVAETVSNGAAKGDVMGVSPKNVVVID